MQQPGLDNRHRDKDGTIARKHGNTLMRTLRETYGAGFAPGYDPNAKLQDCLHKLAEKSLSRNWCTTLAEGLASTDPVSRAGDDLLIGGTLPCDKRAI